MQFIELESSEISHCQSLVLKLHQRFGSASADEFIHDAALYACEIPKRVRLLFKDLKYSPNNRGVFVVRGFPVEHKGPTPESWDYPESYQTCMPIDYLSVLLSTLVGDVFGWETQQKGKLIHDLIPIKGKGAAQTGYGSSSELVLHTEDSFHQYRGDYLCFYCIRNLAKVATTFVSTVDLSLSDELKEILFQQRFFIMPDDSHLDENQTEGGVSERYIQSLCDDNKKLALLYGNFDNPYMCFDPHYTIAGQDSDECRQALNELIKEVDKNIIEYALSPGDICLLDNRKVAHGRGAFEPSHDGNDRWLKRINITSNLRKSADSRRQDNPRIIGEPQVIIAES